MSGVTPFKHSPSDKRGLGLTFLGMMAQEQETGEYVTREAFNQAMMIMRRDQNELRDLFIKHVLCKKVPWYVRFWRRTTSWLDAHF